MVTYSCANIVIETRQMRQMPDTDLGRVCVVPRVPGVLPPRNLRQASGPNVDIVTHFLMCHAGRYCPGEIVVCYLESRGTVE